MKAKLSVDERLLLLFADVTSDDVMMMRTDIYFTVFPGSPNFWELSEQSVDLFLSSNQQPRNSGGLSTAVIQVQLCICKASFV